MAGTITHKWDGTVLTITSDSGTSSMDLKGKKGDTGIRGPQGRAGVILNEDGTIDWNGYATEAYVIDAIETALEDYTPSGGGGGSGGGGSTNNAVLTVKSTTGWTYKTIADGASCILTGTWSSLENELETGGGTLTLYVGNAIKATKNIPQGNFSIDVTQYLGSGNNTVKIKITDVYGNSRTIAFTINKVSLTISSTFNAAVAYEGAINYTYTPNGSTTKTIHFILDGKEIGTTEVKTSGRQQTYTIPAQSHGSHTFEVYFTTDIDGEEVQSNHLYYDLICIESGNATPIISCPYNNSEMEQFETISIPYVVYSPSSLTSSVILAANGTTVNELVVDRTQQTWAYRADNSGEVVLTITCGSTVKTITLNVTASTIDVEATTENLELFLSSYGRSNSETNPASWSYEDIACTFENYNWISDGWLIDEDGITVHRVTGDARLTIPLQMFGSDFRTTGKTIEFEFATRNVRNYNTEIISCYSGDIGFKITAQEAILKSEQSEISTQYKEDEHIRLSFVVEKRVENRLVFIYLNGIMCGAIQYPTDDNFAQANPVNISIGSNDCTIDLYNIRIYNNNLTRYQILDNWIADTQNIKLKMDRYTRNNIYDAYGNIVIENLPANLPYLVLNAETLPQYKGNKITLDGAYTDLTNPNNSFTFTDAEADVQGTSSAGYARKNYKIKYKNGFTQNGASVDNYKMRSDSIPTNVFTFKADVASSEGANNVELVRLYNDICPYRTPPQETNASIRQGIDGFPIVIFQNDGTNTTFIGKYNFNNDKGTPEVYGFTNGDESWETKNNTSNRVLYKNADFSGDDWKNDFEARYPEDNVDTTNLARFASWVVSTDTTAATGDALESAVTYDGVEYTNDTAEYRLAKFRAEISNYTELDSALFYYLFTELFLMVDSRAKNAFPSMIGGDKVCWLPYDMDTAVGIDNEGALKFGYELEDIDTTESGADVYNGQQSVFWCNIRDAFGEELKAMYQKLRSDNKLSYDIIENAYEQHQSKWPEAVWNEDAYYKYLEPLLVDGSGIYLPMLQGSKSEQRKWWLYNRFKYIDSKYNAGDSLSDFITLRGYDKSDITVTPYADIYASIKYGSYLVQQRALRGSSYTLACPLDNLNDTEIYIYSASQLQDVGDLSGLKVGLADFSMATKLQNLKIGDSDSSYDNSNLTSLTLGNNVLLKTLDVRNCSAFGTGEQQTIDLSGCTNIEEIYLEGTSIKGVNLPNGGILKTLHLPDTITNLTVCNQTSLTDFVLNNPSNITTLRLENMDDVISAQKIVEQMADGGRVRIIGASMTLIGAGITTNFFNKLDTMRGLDENGNNVETAQISGTFRVTSDCESYIEDWQARYPNIIFDIWMPALEELSWTQVNELAQRGMLSTFFPVGSEKTIRLSTGEVLTAIIIGFNYDDLSDGSGKAPVTFDIKDCTENTSSSTITSSGWGMSDLRTTINSYFDYLPIDLQNVIKIIKKEYVSYSKDGNGIWHRYVNTSYDKLFALAQHEIMGIRIATTDGGDGYSWSTSDVINLQYEYFKGAEIPEGGIPITEGATTGTYLSGGIYYNTNAIKGLGNNAETKINYRTRAINYRTGTGAYSSEPTCYPFVIYTDGKSNNNRVGATGVTFAFCI